MVDKIIPQITLIPDWLKDLWEDEIEEQSCYPITGMLGAKA